MRERAPQKLMFGMSQHTCYICIHIGLYNQFSSILLLVVWRYKRQYTDEIITFKKSMYMRASGASELRQFSYFHIKKQFLPKCCWYFRYFVGTNGTRVSLPTNYGALWGRGTIAPPPPATLILMGIRYHDYTNS